MCLGILPFFHVFGMALCLSSLSHGVTMVVLPRFIPDHFLTAIQNHKVGFFFFFFFFFFLYGKLWCMCFMFGCFSAQVNLYMCCFCAFSGNVE